MSELNKHQLRFTQTISQLLVKHKDTPIMQRIQLWIRAKTNGQGLSAFIVGAATDEQKSEVMDALEELLKKQDWSVLPQAPNGQTEVAPPREVSKRPVVVGAPEPEEDKPVAAFKAVDDDGSHGIKVPSSAPTADGFGLILEAFIKGIVATERAPTTPQPSKELTIAQVEQVRAICREEVRKTFAGLFDTK